MNYKNLPLMLSKTSIKIMNAFHPWDGGYNFLPCRVGSVGSVSASRTVRREFASRPGHTKDHYKNGTNCLPA